MPCSTHGIFSFEVAGTADRANEALRGCSMASQVTDSLVGDVAFIAGYTVLLVVGAAFFGGRGYRVSALRGASSTMAWLAVIVGGSTSSRTSPCGAKWRRCPPGRRS